MSRSRGPASTPVMAALGLFVLLLLWSVVGASGLVSEVTLPSPITTLRQFVSDVGSTEFLSVHLPTTVWTAFLAVVIGTICGVAIGIVLFRWHRLYRLLRPYLAFANAAPRIALIAPLVLAFGTGIASKIALGVSLTLFVALLAVYGALSSVDSSLTKSVRSLGGTESDVWRYVMLRAIVPDLLGALRVIVSLGLLAAVAGEMIVSEQGLGWLISRRGSVFDIAGVFSIIVVVAIIAAVLNAGVDALSRRAMRWN